MNGHDITITIQTLLSIFGAISVIVAGTSAITKMFSPFKDLKAKVEDHQKHLDEGNERFSMSEKKLEEQSAMQKEICKSLIVIMNHEITGNSVDKLKSQQEELQKFLIDH